MPWGLGAFIGAHAMPRDLIIVESPAKVKTIKKLLGRKYAVEASVGHVRDLPSSSLGVDEADNFAPLYEVIEGKQKVVGKLKEAAAKAGNVFLAPDPDREGEAIAWHVAELIREDNSNIKRILFNEISARAITEALEHPLELNHSLFDSQQSRRILDRLVGYKLSPLLWKKIKRGISAGRVQSVALRLIVDREMERRAFDPTEYWVFKATLSGAQPPEFQTDLHKVAGKKPAIGSEEEALALEEQVKGESFRVEEVAEKERAKQAGPPFITSTLQQAANQRLGFTAKRTMSVAQRLYEGVDMGEKGTEGLITYMRTDSVRVSNEAVSEARKYIRKKLGKEYCPPKPRVFKTKSSAQDAHEAIRPVDPTLTPEEAKQWLPKEQHSLYALIWERFMASQMTPAKFWDTTVTVKAGDTLWRTKGERLLFDGFLAVSKQGSGKGEQRKLPELQAGQALTLGALDKEQKFTLPPPRYNEASLVKELEEKGIGRPSTYAAIISTLVDRDYARLEEKQFAPSELGETVCNHLVKHFSELMDVGFTAQMENALDEVAEGRENMVDLLRKFAGDFNPALDLAQKEMATVKGGLDTDLVCEECGQPMRIKFGKAGSFLACSGYPECSNTMNFIRDGKGAIEIVEQEKLALEKVGECPDCGEDLVLKRSRTGSRFIACSGYPKCKHAEPFTTGVPCPREDCKGTLVEKSTRRGKVFYSCDQYPQCDYALWYWPVPEPCPECGSKVLVRKVTKTRGEHIACPVKGCKYVKEEEEEGEEG